MIIFPNAGYILYNIPGDGCHPEPVLQAGQAGDAQGVILGVATRAPRVLIAVNLLKLRNVMNNNLTIK